MIVPVVKRNNAAGITDFRPIICEKEAKVGSSDGELAIAG